MVRLIDSTCGKIEEKVRVLSIKINPISATTFTSKEWSMIKSKIAEVAANCIIDLISDKNISAIYYLDLSGGEANLEDSGRDVDLIVVVRKDLQIDREELENTIETTISKLLVWSGLQKKLNMTPKNLVEIHVVKDPEKDYYGRVLRSIYTPPIRLWPPQD